MDENILAYRLDVLFKYDYKKKRTLLNHFNSLLDIFKADKTDLAFVPDFNENDANILIYDKDYSFYEKKYNEMLSSGIRFIPNFSDMYPKKLKNYSDSPFALYVRGNLPDENKKTVAIVGARNSTREGIELAKKFGRTLAENGIQIISGLARGVDVSAQKGALSLPSAMVFGILGTGVDICYPAENIETFMEIEKRGGLISEYPPKTPGKPLHFPMRNRIISALSDGILIIEAREKSGSLITAKNGLEQGKDIFVVPGSVLNPAYTGSNELIKQGACLVTNTRDILDGLGIFVDYEVSDIKKLNEKKLNKDLCKIYNLLGTEPLHLSYITEILDISIPDAMEKLLELERCDMIEIISGQYFAIKL